VKRKGKRFVFGVDGAPFSLMKRWVADGELYTLESMVDHGITPNT
jgi:hypothetical protein